MSLYDAARPTYRVLCYRNYDTTLRSSHRGHQGHSGRIKVWRWESQLYRPLGPQWQQYTYDKIWWLELIPSLVSLRSSDGWHKPTQDVSLLPSIDPDAACKEWICRSLGFLCFSFLFSVSAVLPSFSRVLLVSCLSAWGAVWTRVQAFEAHGAAVWPRPMPGILSSPPLSPTPSTLTPLLFFLFYY